MMADEIAYQMTMACAAKMLEKHLITQQEYLDFEQLMLEKYTPPIGALFSDLDLI